jgi:hypothetical protein
VLVQRPSPSKDDCILLFGFDGLFLTFLLSDARTAACRAPIGSLLTNSEGALLFLRTVVTRWIMTERAEALAGPSSVSGRFFGDGGLASALLCRTDAMLTRGNPRQGAIRYGLFVPDVADTMRMRDGSRTLLAWWAMAPETQDR